MTDCPTLFIVFILFWMNYRGTLCLSDESTRIEHDLMNDAPAPAGYSLLRNDIARQRLKVKLGKSAPLLHVHLPIQLRARKGQVCRVESEEYQPLMSMVGHLEPKKFDCSFAEGDVIYYHSGNPLSNHDHVQVTIFYFRQNNSVVQTVDIMVDIEEEPKVRFRGHSNQNDRVANTDRSLTGSRVDVIGQLNVTGMKSTTASLSPEILRIFYNMENEECRLSYTSPDYRFDETGYENRTEYMRTTIGGTYSPRFGLPLAPGDAVGGTHRWPLFGGIVAFNRSTVSAFDHECQEALLQGYRYMHRKANSPATDYIPLQVTISQLLTDGSRKQIIREGLFLKVSIVHGQPLKKPIAKTFRQVCMPGC